MDSNPVLGSETACVGDDFPRCCEVSSSMFFFPMRQQCRRAAVGHTTPLMLTLYTRALCFFSDIHITLAKRIHSYP